MGWQIQHQSTSKAHRGSHKVFIDYAKAQSFLSQHKNSYLVQSVFANEIEWKVYFADYEGMEV